MGASNEVVVYVAAYPFPVDRKEILPALRAEEIASCGSEAVRAAKYYVWKLLERAAAETYGLDIGGLGLRREGEKWVCAEFCFSLSHSGDCAAVALSHAPVGVDLEAADPSRFSPALRKKILTPREAYGEEGLGEAARALRANELWTRKEALFKLRGGTAFHPAQIETDRGTWSAGIEVRGRKFFLSVASEEPFTVTLR